ncbi:hypothetical protein BVC93_14175 [Mycobacterium sp. MS1601]|uniref:allophanate hydrolase-related protein n=1 Tax=Mycobacterium sp. MS1601 TaxID=1936029 RepID=UPI00097925F7|nr:hypothetical protein [Mycobacterium sp. MS1601]AQA03370.1 hypothetical protein BVC93_14175 [Mycobacterium sp. MS1601]
MSELRMFVNGQAMSGGSINFALQGATFLGPARTSAKYRFHSFRDEFPGLRVAGPAEQGHAVPGEVYQVTYDILRQHLLPNEPPELELTVIELEDGSGSLCMQVREGAHEFDGVVDISDRGGWREYLRSIGSNQ